MIKFQNYYFFLVESTFHTKLLKSSNSTFTVELLLLRSGSTINVLCRCVSPFLSFWYNEILRLFILNLIWAAVKFSHMLFCHLLSGAPNSINTSIYKDEELNNNFLPKYAEKYYWVLHPCIFLYYHCCVLLVYHLSSVILNPH